MGHGAPTSPCATELPPNGWGASIILLEWGGAVQLEPISDFSQGNWGFHTVRGGDDPRKLGFIPGLSNFERYRMTSGPGMGPYRPRVELAL